jgi:hypothetical protein
MSKTKTKTLSREHRQKMSVAKLAEKNPMWKADKVGYGQLHTWVKRRLPKPALCQRCFNGPAYDLANVTGIYKRDRTNWKYLCRHCHMWFDGRLHARDQRGRFASPRQMKVYSPLLSQYKKRLHLRSLSLSLSLAREKQRGA